MEILPPVCTLFPNALSFLPPGGWGIIALWVEAQ